MSNATVPSGTLEVRQQTYEPRGAHAPFTRICGTCGAVIAGSHVQRHIDWHNTPHNAAQVVTTSLDPQLR